ncbi:gibberellin-regulated protein 7 [Selaginella moellendorffii]|uniref:gibberellin-regulated protein 7 n=1 Tax=Selaginella moellendorffii TaxID=88036 RepID=UPI000D1CD3B8|nr:gibberellin-regulated protein 7 [Selaginella moellendorffii]|eukprot:XP_024530142.1 gibberellin-regulated protein 7 [Selaginella moellendorffii]
MASPFVNAMVLLFLLCAAAAATGSNEESREVLDTTPASPATVPSPAPVPAPVSPGPSPVSPVPAPAAPLNCTSACETRCLVANLHKRCLKYCNICCVACHCVPSGHSGNEDECPCYRDKKNSRGGDKCP